MTSCVTLAVFLLAVGCISGQLQGDFDAAPVYDREQMCQMFANMQCQNICSSDKIQNCLTGVLQSYCPCIMKCPEGQGFGDCRRKNCGDEPSCDYTSSGSTFSDGHTIGQW